ncbi:MAG: hypothetical protein JKY63_06155 [Rhodobiaceae bacterium]|nr:hypothetical protein [Rhodobiaceae bacterium]
MKIGDKKPVGRAATAATSQPSSASAAGGSVLRTEGRVITDTTSIMGIPEPELTPNVRNAIMTLMGEVDNMRKELRATRERLRSAEALADHDGLLPSQPPCLCERALWFHVLREALRHTAQSALH